MYRNVVLDILSLIVDQQMDRGTDPGFAGGRSWCSGVTNMQPLKAGAPRGVQEMFPGKIFLEI